MPAVADGIRAGHNHFGRELALTLYDGTGAEESEFP